MIAALLPGDDEPTRGSVVLRRGPTGTAYQRRHSDGRWCSMKGDGDTPSFEELVGSANPGSPTLLVYLAPDE